MKTTTTILKKQARAFIAALLPLSMVLSFCAFVPGSALAAPVAQAAAPAPRFGTIDYGKVINSSKMRIQAATEIRQMQRNIETVGKRVIQTGVYFLSVEELGEIAALYEKDKPTPADLKRIETLEAKSGVMRRELTTLQNTPKPTEAQSARLAELNNLMAKGDDNLKTVQQGMEKRIEDKALEVDRKAEAQIKAAVAKVAKSKKLSVVFSGRVVVYDTMDITEDVVKEVSK